MQYWKHSSRVIFNMNSLTLFKIEGFYLCFQSELSTRFLYFFYNTLLCTKLSAFNFMHVEVFTEKYWYLSFAFYCLIFSYANMSCYQRAINSSHSYRALKILNTIFLKIIFKSCHFMWTSRIKDNIFKFIRSY